MFAEPPDFDHDALADVLRSDWNIDGTSLEYAPVGFGTHHYDVTDGQRRWFVNVDEYERKTWISDDPKATFDGLDRSLRTALELRRAGLEFVHAPLERRGGGVLSRIDGGYAVSVFDHIEGRSDDFGEYADLDERSRVLDAVRQIHAATETVDPAIPRTHTLAVPSRAAFLDLLDALDQPWHGGPFSEAVRAALTEHRSSVLERFVRYDVLVELAEQRFDELVITHGEPHAANVIWTDDGLRLIDWDTVAFGLPERDLWMLGSPPDADPDGIAVHREWWALSEITGYATGLHAHHIDDANTRTAMKGLLDYLSN